MNLQTHIPILAQATCRLLYPPKCPFCRNLLEKEELVCPSCRSRVRPITGPVCMRCGKPVDQDQEYCPSCRSRSFHFREGIAVFSYDTTLKDTMLSFKSGGQQCHAKALGTAMAVYAAPKFALWEPHLLVPIPIHSSRQKERGFNQAALLAREISRRSGIPCREDLLVKIHPTKAQKTLSARERRGNLRRSFQATRRLDGLRLVLIDDVFTTGSTIDAAAACLLSAGASQVFFLTLCIA